ncbi:MAG TPA: diaminopimelate epimerase [Xanthomonadales bacterium]|nr:diaminopimelate epimerase [Xanthomonadales bacterium]
MHTTPATRRFFKMQGAGNDFVVLDLRQGDPAPDPALCRFLADRRFGVGCDQILTIEAPVDPGSLAAYRIWNADGSRSGQCGNGARCIAHYLYRHDRLAVDRFTLDSPAGPIDAHVVGPGRYALDMGRPQFEPSAIGLVLPGAAPTVPSDPYRIELNGESVSFGAVSMGNPHAVLVVDAVAHAPVERLGPAIQASGVFRDGVNVGFVEPVSASAVRLRVFERGVGETLACGSAACAAVAVLARRGLVGADVAVHLPGGVLDIAWSAADDGGVIMTGPAAFVFEGELCRNESALAASSP